MDQRRLGAGWPPATALGLGLAALGRPGYINLGHAADLAGATAVADLAARAYEVLDGAWAAGLRSFDAARSYGRGEEFLGAWLRDRQIAPGAALVSSKWGYRYTAGWQVAAAQHEVKEHSLTLLQQQWAESQANLGAHLRLYQIHSATLESGVLEDGAVLGRLAELRAGGLLIGLSVSGPRQAAVIRRALAVRADGAPLFASVQATWNLLEPSAGPALAEAHSAGLAVIVKEALANGRLTERGGPPAALASLAAELGCGLDALGIAAALAQPWAGVVLSGAASLGQLHANLAALTVDRQAAAALAARPGLAEPPEQYWQTRAGLPWN